MSGHHSGHEIEIKLRLRGADDGLARLRGLGFQAVTERVFEQNEVFDDTGLSLRAGKCLLRVRQVGGEVTLTFKGAPVPGRHKSREEIELRLSDAAAMGRVLSRLGYEPVFRYEKYRTTFARADEPGQVTLDETPIGDFFELEGPPEWIDRTAGQLGFSEGDYITASYGSLFAQHCEATGSDRRHMVFGEAG